MFGDGMVCLGTRRPSPGTSGSVKSSPKMVCSSLTLLPTCSAAGRPLDGARRVGELHRQVARRLGDPAERVDEVHVPRGPAEFPVGGRLQADFLLHPYGPGDLLVLDRPQLIGRDPARRRSRRAPEAAAAGAAGCRRGRPGTAGWFCGTWRTSLPSFLAERAVVSRYGAWIPAAHWSTVAMPQGLSRRFTLVSAAQARKIATCRLQSCLNSLRHATISGNVRGMISPSLGKERLSSLCSP